MKILAFMWLIGFICMIGLMVAPIIPHLSLKTETYPEKG